MGVYMPFEPVYKKPGDPIRSEEWNSILDELITLRKYIENMTRSVTLTGLESQKGKSCRLSTDAPEGFNFGMDVMGLITRQYYGGANEICRFGINDFADVIYYWSGAKGDSESLKIQLEYVDGTFLPPQIFFINDWSRLRPKSDKNPYLEYLLSPDERVWYRYGIKNSIPGKEIRYIIFEDESGTGGIRIGNVIQYVTRVLPLSKFWKEKQ